MTFTHLPHVCDTPLANSPRPNRAPLYPVGTIWCCDECGTHWHYREQFSYYLGEWRRVRFWNLLAKHRIRKAAR